MIFHKKGEKNGKEERGRKKNENIKTRIIRVIVFVVVVIIIS